MAAGAEAAGDMEHGAHGPDIEHAPGAVLVPVIAQVVEKPGLPRPQQARQGDGGAHVGEGVVGPFVGDTVGSGEILEPEARQAVVAPRPLDAVGSQTDGPPTLYHPVGCGRCNGTGYRGRLVIAEVLLVGDRIRQAVLGHATATELHRIAVDEGMRTMYQDGLRKALDGRTTVEEVLRVAAED
jgi:hypothetical protein